MPSKSKTMNEIFLIVLGSRWKNVIIALEKSVMIVKVMMKPVMIPNGLALFPVNDPARMMGRIGKIQGEIINATPSTKASISVNHIVHPDALLEDL